MTDQRTEPFDPSQVVVGFQEGEARLIPSTGGPPARVKGFTVGAPVLARNPPHGGEMHPDGDELLILVSGHVVVVLEEDAGKHRVELRAGQALVVPRGVWHRVELQEKSQLVHVTPGPGGEHRPLPATDER